ncbi:MAG: hypothetical protein ACYCY5_03435 [Sulfuricella sp.]
MEIDETKKMNSIASYNASNVPSRNKLARGLNCPYHKNGLSISLATGNWREYLFGGFRCSVGRQFGSPQGFLGIAPQIPQRMEDFRNIFRYRAVTDFTARKWMNTANRFIINASNLF